MRVNVPRVPTRQGAFQRVFLGRRCRVPRIEAQRRSGVPLDRSTGRASGLRHDSPGFEPRARPSPPQADRDGDGAIRICSLRSANRNVSAPASLTSCHFVSTTSFTRNVRHTPRRRHCNAVCSIRAIRVCKCSFDVLRNERRPSSKSDSRELSLARNEHRCKLRRALKDGLRKRDSCLLRVGGLTVRVFL
jgi:hypothetical protein